MDQQHPLPWSVPGNGSVSLVPSEYPYDEEQPYTLRVGRHDAMIARLTRDDLVAIRDQIDRVLASRHRVLILNGTDDGRLPAAIRARLDDIRRAHGRPTVCVADDTGAVAAYAAVEWASTAPAAVQRFATVAEMLAAGGNIALVVAGPTGLEAATAAHDARIPVRLIRDLAEGGPS